MRYFAGVVMILPAVIVVLAGLCASSNWQLPGDSKPNYTATKLGDESRGDAGKSANQNTPHFFVEPLFTTQAGAFPDARRDHNAGETLHGMEVTTESGVNETEVLAGRKIYRVNVPATKASRSANATDVIAQPSAGGQSTFGKTDTAPVNIFKISHEEMSSSNIFGFAGPNVFAQPSTNIFASANAGNANPFATTDANPGRASVNPFAAGDAIYGRGHMTSSNAVPPAYVSPFIGRSPFANKTPGSTGAVNSANTTGGMSLSAPHLDISMAPRCTNIFCSDPTHNHIWNAMKKASDVAMANAKATTAAQRSDSPRVAKKRIQSSSSSSSSSSESSIEDAETRIYGRRLTKVERKALPEEERDRLYTMCDLVGAERRTNLRLKNALQAACRVQEHRQALELPPFVPNVDPRHIFPYLRGIPAVDDAIESLGVQFGKSNKKKKDNSD